MTLPVPAARRSIELLLVFLLFLLPATLSSGGGAAPEISAALLPLLLTACPQAALVVYLLAIQGEARRPELGLCRPRPVDWARALLLLAAMLALLVAASVAVTLAPEAQRSALSKGVRFRLTGWQEIPAAILFCAVGAFREELLYRSYLFVRLTDLGLSPAASAAVSSLAFAVAHAYQGPLAVALALAQASIMAAAFARWRSIAVPVAAHAAHNLLVLGATLLPGGGFPV